MSPTRTHAGFRCVEPPVTVVFVSPSSSLKPYDNNYIMIAMIANAAMAPEIIPSHRCKCPCDHIFLVQMSL